MPYESFMEYYDNLANLKNDIESLANDIESLANYIKGANLTGYQQWYGREIEYIAKIIKKYGLTI